MTAIIGKKGNEDMLTPKFKVGDRVCAVTTKYNKEYVNVKCDVCKSTGTVKIRSKLYKCPECNGRQEISSEDLEYVVEHVNAEIGKVTIEEYSSNYIDAFHKNRVYYMISATGVGSGQTYDENDGMLFRTLKEAEDFCKNYAPEGKPYNLKPVLKNPKKVKENKKQ